MEVHMDSPNKSTKVLITQTLFELQTPDFARKFTWTVQSNGKIKKYNKYKSTKIRKYKTTKVQNRKVKKFKKLKKCKKKIKKYKN